MELICLRILSIFARRFRIAEIKENLDDYMNLDNNIRNTSSWSVNKFYIVKEIMLKLYICNPGELHLGNDY